jgi:hypothetical protein
MFILEILLGLKSMQGDVTCAFLHADLEENETVYVDMPMGFAQYGKNGKHTPAESKPLVKDADGEGAHGGFSYSSAVGMLLYLSGHT